MKERIRSGCLVVLFLLIENGSCWLPLSIHPVTTGSTASSRLLGSSSDSNSQVLETTNGGDALTMDTPLNPSLEDLFRSAQKVSQPKQAETTAEGAHDAFRPVFHSMKYTTDFDYDLPEELIAQSPLSERAESRLLIVPPDNGPLIDSVFSDLDRRLRSGDLLVVN